jgi:hypothetical protein
MPLLSPIDPVHVWGNLAHSESPYDPASGIAASEPQDLGGAHPVEVALDLVLQAGGRGGEVEGFL